MQKKQLHVTDSGLQLSAEDEDVTKTGNEEAVNRPEEREKWKIVPSPCLSNIPEDDGTKGAKFRCKIHACFQKRKNKKGKPES